MEQYIRLGIHDQKNFYRYFIYLGGKINAADDDLLNHCCGSYTDIVVPPSPRQFSLSL